MKKVFYILICVFAVCWLVTTFMIGKARIDLQIKTEQLASQNR